MVAVSEESVGIPAAGIDRAHRRVIVASSLGTRFEWYDFYLYGSLAAIISKQFFSGVNESTAFIFGGFLPSIAFAMIACTGNIYSGLWYPVIVCVMTVIVGTFFLRETHGNEAV